MEKKNNANIAEHENLEKWKTLIQVWDKEADRFWARNNIFLVTVGAILSVAMSLSKNHLINIFISIFGIIFVSLWIKVNIVGKFYIDRWKIVLKEFEKDSTIKVFKKLEEIDNENEIAKKYEASTTYMLYALYLLRGIWILILIYNTFLLASDIWLKNHDILRLLLLKFANVR